MVCCLTPAPQISQSYNGINVSTTLLYQCTSLTLVLSCVFIRNFDNRLIAP